MATIIVQESDEAIIDVITLALEEEGHHTIGLLDQCPFALSQKLRLYIPDIVFLDYRAAYETGIALFRAVKEFSPRLPVIALSCDINISQTAQTVGFSSYIQKPFDLEDLFNKVKLFVNR